MGDCEIVDDSESVGKPSRVVVGVVVAAAVIFVIDIVASVVCVLLFAETVLTTNPLGDRLGLFVALGDMEGEEPLDSDDVGDAVTVILLVAVLEKEAVGDELELTVPEADGVVVGVREEEGVIDIVALSV